MKSTQLFILFCVAGFMSVAQERLGIANSNYFSTTSIHLNPSSSVDCRTYMQLNLAGVNAFAKTNFAYLPAFNVAQIINPPQIIRSTTERKSFLYAVGSVEGPTYIFSHRTYGIGFFTRVRGVADMRRVSYELASVLLNGNGIGSPDNRDLMGQSFRNAKFSSMSWAEFGVNFGKMIRRSRDELFILGGNLKYLSGINIMYANIIRFDSYNNDNGSFGVTDLNTKVVRNNSQFNSGRGFGLDIGITFKKMSDYVEKYYSNSKLSNCRYVDYKYKIGIALRDAGYIRFKGPTNKLTRSSGAGEYDPTRGAPFIDALQYNFSSSTTEGEPILASLPTALTGQFDYNFDNNIYLNFTAIKNLVPNRVTGVQSPDLISICPRVEFKKFEFGLPLTFQKFIHPQIGFGIRYRSFVIGVDNMIPLFIRRDTYGLNFYCSLAYSIFTNPVCGTRNSSVNNCPSWRKSKKDRPKRRKSFSPKKKANVF